MCLLCSNLHRQSVKTVPFCMSCVGLALRAFIGKRCGIMESEHGCYCSQWKYMTTEFCLWLWLWSSTELSSLGRHCSQMLSRSLIITVTETETEMETSKLGWFKSFLVIALFFPNSIFYPLGKEEGKKEHDTNYGIFLEISGRWNVYSQVSGACSLHWIRLPILLFSTLIFWLNIT